MGLRFEVVSILVILSQVVFFIDANNRFVCYYNRAAPYRKGVGRYTVDEINPKLCTHMIYGYADLEATTYKIVVGNTISDIDDRGYEKFVSLKTKNPHLKVMIGLGSWNESFDGASKYSKMMSNANYISTFSQSVIAFLQRYKFDGLDLRSCPTAADAIGFTNLVVALKKDFNPHRYLLSAVGSQFKLTIDAGYDFARLNKNLDFLVVWAMAFRTPQRDPDNADHHAPLSKRSSYASDELNANFAVQRWIRNGMLPEKIVLGLAVYGRSWTLSSNKTNPPAPAKGAGAPGKMMDEAGFLAYYEICDAVRNDGWVVVKDPSQTMGPYAFSPNSPRTWVGYDDPTMAVVKTAYVLSNGLGGIAAWDVSLDDFRNSCGNGFNPILTAIYNTFKTFWHQDTETTSRTTQISIMEKQNQQVKQPDLYNVSIAMSYVTDQAAIGNCECVCDEEIDIS